MREKTKGGPLRARPAHTFDVERQLAGMSPITPSIKYAMLMSSSNVWLTPAARTSLPLLSLIGPVNCEPGVAFSFSSSVAIAARVSSERYFLAGVILAGIGGFALIFINLAVGIIGSSEDPRNLVFYAIPALGFLGAIVGRFKSTILIRLLMVMAAVQLSAAFLAPIDMVRIMIPFTGLFVGLWLSSAFLIRRATHP